MCSSISPKFVMNLHFLFIYLFIFSCPLLSFVLFIPDELCCRVVSNIKVESTVGESSQFYKFKGTCESQKLSFLLM